MNIRFMAIVVCALVLEACSGGGNGAPTLGDALSADFQATQSATAGAAVNLPRFGRVTQSSNAGSVAGITGDAASVWFDGTSGRLTIRREDGSRLHLNSAKGEIGDERFDSPIEGHTGTTGIFSDYTDTSVSVARVTVSWDKSDPTDHLAGGYWVHLEANRDLTEVKRAEIGAFVDGPELSSPPTLPKLGTASYSGPAAALFAQVYGSGIEEVPAGSTETGMLSSVIDLTADFDARTISGCVGCSSPVYVSGYFTNAETGLESYGERTSKAQIHLGPAPIGSDGSFRNRAVSLVNPDFEVERTTGAWGGRFSNIQDAEGDPRLVAGTFGGEAVTVGGTEAVFVGTYYATK